MTWPDHDRRAEPSPDLTTRPALARPIEYLIVIVGIILAITVGMLVNRMGTLITSQEQGVERGYKNRAVACNLLLSQGLPLTNECTEEVIRPYLDPSIKPGSAVSAIEATRSRELLCVVVTQQNRQLPPERRLSIPPSLCPE